MALDDENFRFPAVEHYNYDEIDVDCTCTLCTSYKESMADYVHTLSLVPGHGWHCKCQLCKQKRAQHQAMLAISNKRDLYCELSYLTDEHPFSAPFLGWVLTKIRDMKFKSEAWWASHCPKKPLRAWMNEWQKANLTKEIIAVSGMY